MVLYNYLNHSVAIKSKSIQPFRKTNKEKWISSVSVEWRTRDLLWRVWTRTCIEPPGRVTSWHPWTAWQDCQPSAGRPSPKLPCKSYKLGAVKSKYHWNLVREGRTQCRTLVYNTCMHMLITGSDPNTNSFGFRVLRFRFPTPGRDGRGRRTWWVLCSSTAKGPAKTGVARCCSPSRRRQEKEGHERGRGLNRWTGKSFIAGGGGALRRRPTEYGPTSHVRNRPMRALNKTGE